MNEWHLYIAPTSTKYVPVISINIKFSTKVTILVYIYIYMHKSCSKVLKVLQNHFIMYIHTVCLHVDNYLTPVGTVLKIF
jgi:hypothetical protein